MGIGGHHHGGRSMIKETVCVYCSYRYKFDTKHLETWCPICGAHNYTDDLEAIRTYLGEAEE